MAHSQLKEDWQSTFAVNAVMAIAHKARKREVLQEKQLFKAESVPAMSAALAEERPQFKKLLVPFDFSHNATALVEQLIPWAASSETALHLIYVVEATRTLEGTEQQQHEHPQESVTIASKKLLAAWARKMMRARIPTQFSVQMGDPAECIARYANDIGADLIVMSTCGYGRLKDVFSRSTTEQVSSRAACPVLAWPETSIRHSRAGHASEQFLAARTILVPVDFSDASRKALRDAAALAERNDAELLLLSVTEEVGRETSVEEAVHRTKVENWAHQEIGAGTRLRCSVWIGMSSLYAILLEAKRSKADLIVLPARRRSWVNRFHMAHLTDSILRHAPCPVLSIPAIEAVESEERN